MFREVERAERKKELSVYKFEEILRRHLDSRHSQSEEEWRKEIHHIYAKYIRLKEKANCKQHEKYFVSMTSVIQAVDDFFQEVQKIRKKALAVDE